MGIIKTTYLANDYQTQYGIVVNSETLGLTINGQTNNSSGGVYIDAPPIKITGSRRSNRSFARVVRVSPSRESVPPTRRLLFRLPWLRPDGFADFTPGMEGTYKGQTVYFVDKLDEKRLY